VIVHEAARTAGIGAEIDRQFFNEIALQNSGTAFFIDENENLNDRLGWIYEQITSPVLTGAQISGQGLSLYDVLPQPIGNLGKGAQILQTGRYLQPGNGSLKFAAFNGEATVDSSATINMSQVPQNEYVARFWAAHKIAELQQQIEEFGENQELVNAIIALSIHYSVLSKYTAFIVVEPTGDDEWITSTDAEATTPGTFSLLQNYPNPFNPETTIKFSIPVAGFARLEIYNLLGELVRTLFVGEMNPGEHSFVWDGKNDRGVVMPSGVYVYKLQAGSFTATRKMILLR